MVHDDEDAAAAAGGGGGGVMNDDAARARQQLRHVQDNELLFASAAMQQLFRESLENRSTANMLPALLVRDGALGAAVALLKAQLMVRVAHGARIVGSTLPPDAGLGAMGAGHGVQGETRAGGSIEVIVHLCALVGRGEVEGVRVWDLGAASGHCASVMAVGAGDALTVVGVEVQPALHAAGVGGLQHRLDHGFFEGTGAALPLLLRGDVLELVSELLALPLAQLPPTAAVTAYTDGMPHSVLTAIALCARALGAYLVVVTCRAVAVVLAALRRSGARWHAVATVACSAVGDPPTRFTQVVLANVDQLALAPAARARQRVAALAAARAAVRLEAADMRAAGLLPEAGGGGSSMLAALAVAALGPGERVCREHNELVMDANLALRLTWMAPGVTSSTRSQGGAAAGGGGGGGGAAAAAAGGVARRRAEWEAAARHEVARVAALTDAEKAAEAREAAAAASAAEARRLAALAARLARDEAKHVKAEQALVRRRDALVSAQTAAAAAAVAMAAAAAPE